MLPHKYNFDVHAPNVLGNPMPPMMADICLREPAADFWAHLGEQHKSFPEDAATLSVKPRGHIGGLRVWGETRVKVPVAAQETLRLGAAVTTFNTQSGSGAPADTACYRVDWAR